MESGQVDIEVARNFILNQFWKSFNQSLDQQDYLTKELPNLCSEEDIHNEKHYEYFKYSQNNPIYLTNIDYFILFKQLKQYSKKPFKFFSKQRN